MEIEWLASNLRMVEPGLWKAPSESSVSYPDEGNAWCFSIEDSSFWFAHRNRCILETIKRFPTNGLFLDVGSGNGFVSLAIHKAGREVACLEPGKIGALNAKTRGLPIVINSSFEEAGFKSCSLGAIGLFDVMEHIQDDRGFLLKLKESLVPDGKIFLTVPAYPCLWSKEDEFAGHFRRYSPTSISRLVERSGLKIDYLTHVFSILPCPVFFFRVLPFKFGLGKPIDLEIERQRHLQPAGLFGKLLQQIWDTEAAAIKAGLRIPFGASLLVVASKG